MPISDMVIKHEDVNVMLANHHLLSNSWLLLDNWDFISEESQVLSEFSTILLTFCIIWPFWM